MPDQTDNPEKIVLPSNSPTSPDDARSGVWGTDILEEARQTILKIMRNGSRNAAARLKAANIVLGPSFLAELPEEQLLAEVNRRILARKIAPAKP